MADIKASMVKELREKTGVGMMDAKSALVETDGDMEAAVDLLRKKGMAKAAKKSSRTAAEGLVGVNVSGTNGVVIEVNAETDFVARNEMFQEFVDNLSGLALENGAEDSDALAKVEYADGKSVEDTLTELIATIGENMSLRRLSTLSVEKGVVAQYIHGGLTSSLGKIGVLIALESEGDTDKLAAFGKQLAMHVAAAFPQYLDKESVDPEALERERNVQLETAKSEGKPEEIAQKMVEGRMRKYFEEICLLEQTFVIDNETKISKLIENAKDEVGAPVELKGFVRFQLGEGIEVEEEDFAAEVAAVANG
jgi:elongation factor Ts